MDQSSNQDWTIHRFDEIDSTSSWLKSNRDELPDKSVAVAKFQTAGRGRLGRKWEAPAGTALMFSMLLRPEWPIAKSSWLMMITGLAVSESLSLQSGLLIKLKWPNDIVYMPAGHTLHKMGGILSEAQTDNGIVKEAIIGVGLNINMTARQLPASTHTPACSLRSISEKVFDIDLLLESILQRFESYYRQAADDVSPLEEWQNKLVTIGQPVTATLIATGDQMQKIEGFASGVDEWGRLLIQTNAGEIKAVTAGDVTLRT